MQSKAAQAHSLRTKLAILGVMRPGEPITSSEIARRMKVPTDGIANHMRVMTEAGLVRIESVTAHRVHFWTLTAAGIAKIAPTPAPRIAIRKVLGRRDGLCLPNQSQITISLPAEPWHNEDHRA